MAPWDEYVYWETPTETPIHFGAAVVTQVCQRNPRRTQLILAACASSGNILVSVNPNLINGGTQGIVLNPSQPPLMLNQHDWGPLVQEAWYAVPLAAPADMSVTEAVLHKWPSDLIVRSDNG